MKKKIIRIKQISQVVFLLTFVYILWSTTYPLKGLFPAEAFFKLDPLIVIFTSISERIILPGMIFAGLMLIAALLFGRFFCGWICPLGTIIDFVGSLKRKQNISKPVKEKNPKVIKFYILGIIALVAFFGVQMVWMFDPIVIIARFISMNFIPGLTFLINGLFILLLRLLHSPEILLDFYRSLKTSLLGIEISYFAHTGLILLVFVFVISSAYFIQRFWCRIICPLGALYAVCARSALLNRSTKNCVFCGKCKEKCPMGAINEDITYIKSECILCMKCVYACPSRVNRFSFKKINFPKGSLPQLKHQDNSRGISRRNFLYLLATVTTAGLFARVAKGRNKNYYQDIIIRPPAAIKEEEFLNRCIRCGNCMKVCLTNGLQPMMFQAGMAGIWTPQFIMEIGYCEYNCTLCGNVCPTGAIPKLNITEKHKTRIGIAKIDRNLCLPWVKKRECIVCEEFCPVKEKAIKLKEEKVDLKNRKGGTKVLRPYVDAKLCIGCGVCQTKCPVRPVRAIKILPIKADRV